MLRCILFTFLGLTLLADTLPDPQFTKDNELIRPANYRDWIYLTSGLGMSYGVRPSTPDNPPFDNVFVNPTAYRAFKETGHWPDHTIFILEIRQSNSHGSINKAGHFQTNVIAIEAAVKDEARFKDKWAYFNFNQHNKIEDKVTPFAADSACNVCHAKNAAVENTFVQFYPTLLEVARAKGTLNQGYLSAEANAGH